MLCRQLKEPEGDTLSMVFGCITYIKANDTNRREKKGEREKHQLTLINIALLFFSYQYNPINVCRMFKDLSILTTGTVSESNLRKADFFFCYSNIRYK
jgi:hypothetical protein